MSDSQQNLRIAFCGPGGSGKTTLARIISKQYDLPLVTNSIRDTIAEMYGSSVDLENMSFHERHEFQKMALQNQKDKQEKYKDGFVSDRSVYDFLAYYRHFYLKERHEICNKFGFNFSIFAKYVFYVNMVVRDSMVPGYTHLAYVPRFTKNAQHDGIRYSKESRVDDFVESYFESNPPIIQEYIHHLRSNSVENRIAEVGDLICSNASASI